MHIKVNANEDLIEFIPIDTLTLRQISGTVYEARYDGQAHRIKKEEFGRLLLAIEHNNIKIIGDYINANDFFNLLMDKK